MSLELRHKTITPKLKARIPPINNVKSPSKQKQEILNDYYLKAIKAKLDF